MSDELHEINGELNPPQDDIHRMERQLQGLCPECGYDVGKKFLDDWVWFDTHHPDCGYWGHWDWDAEGTDILLQENNNDTQA